MATSQRLRQDFSLAVRTWGFEPMVQEQRSSLQCQEAVEHAAAAAMHQLWHGSVAIVADTDPLASARGPRRLLKALE